jgi:hypothetical protein
MYIQRNSMARFCSHCCSGKEKSITYSECVFVALCIQPAMRMRCHLWPLWLYSIFPRYLINGTIFEKKLLNIKCVFWYSVQLLSETFLILRRTERDIKNLSSFSCKVPVILVRFEWNLNFLYRLSKNIQIPNFIKIRAMWAELFHVEGRTHTAKLTAAFRNFAKAPKRLLNSPTYQRPQYSIIPAMRRLVYCSLYL